MNAEFQKISRRDMKAILSDQSKEIEENNRMRKTRDLYKEIRDTKVTIHTKIGTIKNREVMDLTEAEDIRRDRQPSLRAAVHGFTESEKTDQLN